MWSYEQEGEEAIYGKKNVITGPLYLGDEFAETRVFNEFPLAGLERDKDYYIWIGNQDWNGTSRFRVTNYYAYTTFHTW